VGHKPASSAELAYAEKFSAATAALVDTLRRNFSGAPVVLPGGHVVGSNAVMSWSCYSHCTSLSESGFSENTCDQAVGTGAAGPPATMNSALEQLLGWASKGPGEPPMEWIDACDGLDCGAGCHVG